MFHVTTVGLSIVNHTDCTILHYMHKSHCVTCLILLKYKQTRILFETQHILYREWNSNSILLLLLLTIKYNALIVFGVIALGKSCISQSLTFHICNVTISPPRFTQRLQWLQCCAFCFGSLPVLVFVFTPLVLSCIYFLTTDYFVI